VIGAKTVSWHRADMPWKLGTHDRLDLTRYAVQEMLVEP
jgi:DNA-binding NarL/FixJ family response regulator